MPRRIATLDLRGSDVPDDIDPRSAHTVTAAVEFAQTFNGYAWGGGPRQLGELSRRLQDAWEAGDGLPSDLDRLRACLFLWARARGHERDVASDPREVTWVNALLAAIRSGTGIQPRDGAR